jgi:hypothetical protein
VRTASSVVRPRRVRARAGDVPRGRRNTAPDSSAPSRRPGFFAFSGVSRAAMPSGTGAGKRRLILPAAVAAALPLGVAAALYLALPAAAPEGASARLTPAEPEEGAASPACRERPQRVMIDGARIEAFALLCREDQEGSWVFAGSAPIDPAPEAAILAEENAPPEPDPSAGVVAPNPRKNAVRHSANHIHRPAAAPIRSAHSAYRARYADGGALSSQQKYGP